MFQELYVLLGLATLVYYILTKKKPPPSVELSPLNKSISTQTIYEPLMLCEPMDIDTTSVSPLSDVDMDEVESEESSSSNYILKNHFS